MSGGRWALVGLVVTLASAGACGNDRSTVCLGYEHCACYPNGTCNTGLDCVSGLCVAPLGQSGASSVGGSSSGASGVGGAGAEMSSGGASSSGGDGGSVGVGGSTSSGGSDGVGGSIGSGGSDGVGGSIGSGGSDGVGGSIGSGGSDNAGGSNSVGGSNDVGGAGGASASGGSAGNGGTGAGGGASVGGSAGTGNVGGNVITNGDFSNGMTDWNTDGATASSSVTDGVWCGNFLTVGSHAILGWPDVAAKAASISGTYTLSFKMSLSGSASIIVKVGKAVSPYTADFETVVTPTSTLSTYAYSFTANDPQAGVAFDIVSYSPPTYVCIDDVVLAPVM